MGYLWNRIKRAIVLFKNRKKNIYIDKTCRLSLKNIFMEGGNKLNQEVFFEGRIGYGSYIGPRSSINGVIGRYCSISSEVKTIGGVHPTFGFVSTHPAFFSTSKQSGFTYVDHNCFEENISVDREGHLVYIGNDVWIGAGVQLLPGIHIGDGAIIAAGSVVTKDIEPYVIVGGIPAKVIRKRFSDEQIKDLLKIKWWNQSEEWIKENAKNFSNIQTFLEKILMEERKNYD